jgi:hypothetical protein
MNSRTIDEADEISIEDLEAAAFMYDAIARDGWAAWVKRNEEATGFLESTPESRKMVRDSIEKPSIYEQ